MSRNFGEIIANQCAPVLMNVKPSNLLILTSEEERLFLQAEPVQGISSRLLYVGEKKSTWLLYRGDYLESVLVWPQVRIFLQSYGYQPKEEDVGRMLERLARRFAAYKEGWDGFPHELGIFLGYPLGDVKGFIEHKGQDYIYCGYWKVYQDEKKARNTFRIYRAARQRMLAMISEGVKLCEVGCLAG